MKFALIFTIGFLAFTVEAEMTADQKRRAESFTSVFENDTIKLQYAYVENIHDGRGYTCGRAGFTTGTGDAYEVVKDYTAKKHNNPLAHFLPELKKLADKASGDVHNLNGFPQAWKEACKDHEFLKVQDEVVDRMYYRPAVKLANTVGLKTALSMCAFYDTIIQHGDDSDYDSIGGIIKRTESAVHGTVKSGVDEKKWLREFLKVRRNDLQHPHDKETQEAWAGSVDRVDALVKLLDEGNMDLHGPIHIKTPNHSATIP